MISGTNIHAPFSFPHRSSSLPSVLFPLPVHGDASIQDVTPVTFLAHLESRRGGKLEDPVEDQFPPSRPDLGGRFHVGAKDEGYSFLRGDSVRAAGIYLLAELRIGLVGAPSWVPGDLERVNLVNGGGVGTGVGDTEN